ncbi:MAG: WD40 repeat domain-containing serine/threonine protein kinase, partial [Streptosporangiaceae bacterium]
MDPLRPGDPASVGVYRLIGRQGEGGMGRVYVGLSPGGRQVAVKIIHPAHASDKQFRERFAREIEAARRVGGFHTASVVDADPNADPPWMVTAYIHGRSLQDTVREGGPLPADQVAAIGAGLAEGLAAIHACGLVHRDLKPSNVILAEDGPRIIDFGIARAAGASSMTTAGVVVGTYSYMSPEQVEGHVAGPESDVFALGCTLAYAATARSPFGDDSIAMVVHRIASEPPNLGSVPEAHGLRRLISECLAKSPGERPSLSAIITRLGEAEAPAAAASGNWWDSAPTSTTGSGQNAVTNHPPQSPAPQPQSPAPQPQFPAPQPLYPGSPAPAGGGRRRRGALIGSGVAVIAVVAAVLGVLLSSGHPKAAHLSSGRATPHPTVSPTVPAPAQPEATLHDPAGKDVFGLAFSSNSVLATGDSNGSTYLWNLTKKSITATLRKKASFSVNGTAYDPNSGVFAAADASGDIYLWNASSGGLTATLTNPNGGANDSVAFSPDGGFVAAGNSDGSTYLWDVAAGKLSSTPTSSLRDPSGKSVYGIAFSPQGGLLATGDTNGDTYLWNFATGKLVSTFHDPSSKGLYDVAFSPDGGLLAVSDVSGTDSGVVYLWNVSTGKLAATLQTPAGGSYSDVAFSPSGKVVAVADT